MEDEERIDKPGDQYYLENVDVDKILSYSYEIEQDDIQLLMEIENLSRKVETMKNEIMPKKND